MANEEPGKISRYIISEFFLFTDCVDRVIGVCNLQYFYDSF